MLFSWASVNTPSILLTRSSIYQPEIEKKIKPEVARVANISNQAVMSYQEHKSIRNIYMYV